MGIDLILRCDDRDFCTRPSMAEWDIMARLREFIPDPVDVLVGGAETEMGVDEDVPVVEFLEAIDRVDGFLADQSHLLPATYVFKSEYMLLKGNRFPLHDEFDTGGMSGIELPNDPEHRYAIWAGVEECQLTKVAIDSDGRGRIVERRDLRNEKELETKTCGLIQIRKRNDHAGLRRLLAELREFLEPSSGEMVTRTISG